MIAHTHESLRCCISALLSDERAGCDRKHLDAMLKTIADAANSAPDLLRERDELRAALEWIVGRLERGGKAASSDTIAQARAAIAKCGKGAA